jgi:hypothetical protein
LIQNAKYMVCAIILSRFVRSRFTPFIRDSEGELERDFTLTPHLVPARFRVLKAAGIAGIYPAIGGIQFF